MRLSSHYFRNPDKEGDPIVEAIEQLQNDVASLQNSINDINNHKYDNDKIIELSTVNVNRSDCRIYKTFKQSDGKIHFGIIDFGDYDNAPVLYNYLNQLSTDDYTMDFCILTHYHYDHCEGLLYQDIDDYIILRQIMRLKSDNFKFFLPHGFLSYSDLYEYHEDIAADYQSVVNLLNDNIPECVSYPTENEIVTINGISFKFNNLDPNDFFAPVSPLADKVYYNECYIDSGDDPSENLQYNNCSMITTVEYKGQAVLFPGDVQYEAQLNEYQVLDKDFAIYCVEHHGINRTTPDIWLKAINTRSVSVCGYIGNFDGNYSFSTYDWLRKRGLPCYFNAREPYTITVNQNGNTQAIGSTQEQPINDGVMHGGGYKMTLTRMPECETDGKFDLSKLYGVYGRFFIDEYADISPETGYMMYTNRDGALTTLPITTSAISVYNLKLQTGRGEGMIQFLLGNNSQLGWIYYRKYNPTTITDNFYEKWSDWFMLKFTSERIALHNNGLINMDMGRTYIAYVADGENEINLRYYCDSLGDFYDDCECIVYWKIPANATSYTIRKSATSQYAYFVGADCANGMMSPQAGTDYKITFRYLFNKRFTPTGESSPVETRYRAQVEVIG